jgi:MoxR-like ATPase
MTTMQVRTFLKVAPLLPKTTSVLLRGAHGIGKSQVVRQVAGLIATVEGIPSFEVIDRRLSQMSEGDMIGLPSTDGEVTRFNPPTWYKQACDKPVCLFLDELNRATPEVMQAAFQVVLDRELNGWKLHPQTRVFAAINTGGN